MFLRYKNSFIRFGVLIILSLIVPIAALLAAIIGSLILWGHVGSILACIGLCLLVGLLGFLSFFILSIKFLRSICRAFISSLKFAFNIRP